MTKKEKNADRYFNEDHRDVTQRIEDGFTTLVVGIGHDEKKVAYELAKKKRSYVYPVYSYDATGRFTQHGYAVSS